MGLSMDRWRGKVAVVAGASDGVGAAVVKHLLDEGIIVVGMARRKERIEQLSSSKNLHALKVDITVDQEVIDGIKWVKENLGPIHILINSAGTLWFGRIIENSPEMWRNIYETDVFGLFLLTREVVKDMRENDVDGHIVHVNGLSGHGIYAPCGSILMTAKSAVTSAIECLRRELCEIESKIKISSVSTSFVKTKIFYQHIDEQPEYQELADACVQNENSLATSDVAQSIIYMLSTPPHVQVHDIQIRAIGSL